jgi:uncharacterized protein
MKRRMFILFVVTVTLIYILTNLYLFVKGYRSLPDAPGWKSAFTVLFLFLSAQFIITRFLVAFDSPIQPLLLHHIGGLWMAAMLYFFLIAFAGDLLRLASHVIPWIPDLRPYRPVILLVAVVSVTAIILAGHINAVTPRIRTVDIHISKPSPLEGLRVALVSDIHMGTLIGERDIRRMAAKVTSLDPDLLIIAGDLVDDGITNKLIEQTAPYFHRIQPRYGKVAVPGNHEHIISWAKSQPVFDAFGITVLRDSLLKVNEAFYLAGREDRAWEQMYGGTRKSIGELVSEADPELPLILIDHQPDAIMETVAAGADLHVSGHTHHGQLFPLNFVTKKIFPVSKGYEKIERTHVYVSNGYGTWGPRVRIGNRPEVVLLNITFGIQP